MGGHHGGPPGLSPRLNVVALSGGSQSMVSSGYREAGGLSIRGPMIFGFQEWKFRTEIEMGSTHILFYRACC